MKGRQPWTDWRARLGAGRAFLWLASAGVALLATANVVIAQEPAPAPQADTDAAAGADKPTAQPEADAAAADEKAAAAAAHEATADPADATPRKPAAARGSPQRFEPTEKVRPDFDVAFPVDI